VSPELFHGNLKEQCPKAGANHIQTRTSVVIKMPFYMVKHLYEHVNHYNQEGIIFYRFQGRIKLGLNKDKVVLRNHPEK